jgi:hypothetical protein
MTHPFATHFVLAFAVLGASALATQQSCGVFSSEFTGGGFDRSPIDFELFDFGAGPRLVAAGEFTVAGSVQARRVAQWDGSAWAEVGPGFNADVHDLESVDLGSGPQLFATGRFASSGGQPRNHIARWNGTAWDRLGSGLNNRGWAMCEYPTPAGNRLVVGGEFTTVGGQFAVRVAMWDGTNWSPLGAGIGTLGSGDRVLALAVHDDGTGPALYAAGEIPGGVRRFNGTTWTAVGGGLVGAPQSLASYDDGQGNRLLLVGGNFSAGSTSVFKGWNGTSWQDLGLTGYSGGIDRIVVRQEVAGPAAYLAGSFAPGIGATSTAHLLARWTPTSIGTFPPLDERVRTVAFYDGGAGEELFAGGAFTYLNAAPNPQLQRVGRLAANQWTHVEAPQHALYKTEQQAFVRGLAVRAWTDPTTGERDLYVGGLFAGSSDDPSVTSCARWDGATLSNFNTPGSGELLGLGTWRSSFGASERLVIAKYGGVYAFDGSVWQQLGIANQWGVRNLLEFTPPGATAPVLYGLGLSALQFNGVDWTVVPGAPNATCNAAVVWDAPGALPNGIFVGGIFGTVDALPTNGIALWTGSTWHTFPGTNFWSVHSLALFDDGQGEALYANTNSGLRKFDGTSWTDLGPAGSILAAYDDGSGPALYLSDRVRLRNGVQESFGAATANAPFPVAAHHWVDQYGISQGLFFTGPFDVLGGTPAMGLARYWNPCGGASSYCTAKVNSLGCTPEIGWSGEPSVSAATPFVVTASNVINQKTGGFFFGLNGRNANPFQGGTLCVRAPFVRTAAQSSGGSVGGSDCSGLLALDFTPYLQGALGPGFNLGETVDGQWWYRDPQSSFSLGLTDAIEFQVRP